ncbi:flagellar biosynthetic protein FliR [Imhoffiella purpurea]|uniref:Flagellar biosynthetic protein FliR n=1 Tax=Imhoffiella purpurea TaxID=1249627 RepID=W9VIQ3_9GAMM|nr:flagellar biosynthetic protein FliR [Imhoffiella purpurea]EXJ16881.1 Flagellar biosynthesis protein FliR [Imhoffiella purpurea]
MTFAADDILLWVGAIMWPFVRISAMLLVAPIFGGRNVSARVRLGLALLLALIVAPDLEPVPEIDPLSLDGLVVAIHQVIVGIAMGFVVQIVFAALVLAGESIALSMGLGFASAMDPVSGIQVPMVSQFYTILATLIFLALNGHLILLELLLRSFQTLPIAASGISTDDLWAVVRFVSGMYSSALLVALPAVASLLLINISMGVVTRAAPQLNIFAVGFPVTLLAGLIIIVLTLPQLSVRVGELLWLAVRLVRQLVGA